MIVMMRSKYFKCGGGNSGFDSDVDGDSAGDF